MNPADFKVSRLEDVVETIGRLKGQEYADHLRDIAMLSNQLGNLARLVADRAPAGLQILLTDMVTQNTLDLCLTLIGVSLEDVKTAAFALADDCDDVAGALRKELGL